MPGRELVHPLRQHHPCGLTRSRVVERTSNHCLDSPSFGCLEYFVLSCKLRLSIPVFRFGRILLGDQVVVRCYWCIDVATTGHDDSRRVSERIRQLQNRASPFDVNPPSHFRWFIGSTICRKTQCRQMENPIRSKLSYLVPVLSDFVNFASDQGNLSKRLRDIRGPATVPRTTQTLRFRRV